MIVDVEPAISVNLNHGKILLFSSNIFISNSALCNFRASLKIPFPTKTHRERRASFKHDQGRIKGKSKGALPRCVDNH